jgi:alpha,alpha-trehalose phosphorylase
MARRRAQGSAPPFDAVLFDLDGVVTRTASVHAAAWKVLFDEFLQQRAREREEPFVPFDTERDYLAYVDGKPRHDGVRSFLASRGITLPEGEEDDPPGASTIYGLGRRKDALFKAQLKRGGVEVFEPALALIRRLRAAGRKTAVVTSSRNGREVLRAAALDDTFDVRIDGRDAEAYGLRGKPHPDPFLKAAELLGASPGRAVVVEDAASGVDAGRRGGFALVVGVGRGGQHEALLERGADVVVATLGDLDVADLDARVCMKREAIFAWQIEQEGFDPLREHAVESIFTVGNGYLGVRGTLDQPLPGSQGDLFIAGIYDRKHPARPYSELEFLGEGRGDYPYSELVSAPFPFRMRLRVHDQPLDITNPDIRTHRRVLDLRDAVLHGHDEFAFEADRRVVVRTRRCASRADVHLLLQEITVRLENHSGAVELDASLVDPDLAANHPHLTRVAVETVDDIEARTFTTQASGFRIGLATRAQLVGSAPAPAGERERDTGVSNLRWRVEAGIGDTLRFIRFIAVYTSRDVADPTQAAIAHVQGLDQRAFDTAIEAHRREWRAAWHRADVRIEGSPATEQALRFNAYHLISAAHDDPQVSIGARALTGRAYEGHVFWDVEIFKLPFYLHTLPEVARALLGYRYHTLDGARRRAREMGCEGACYAWESTVTGDDVTPTVIRLQTTRKEIPIFTGTQQIHVTAGVAYAIWRYWEATADAAFLRDAGVEMLVETARFWASRCTRDGGRYHLRGVVGPDEYHHSVNDNAYTNWMARYNLERAAEALEWLMRESPQEGAQLIERLGAAGRENADAWRAVARDLHCPVPNAEGVIEQFDGFFELEEYPLPAGERFKAPISRLFDWDRINELKLIKQADVLMLFHLFPEAFSRDVMAANYRYYEPITDHASSLSPGIHAALAARLGLRDDAARYWRESLWLDLSDTMSNSALGVHPACMGATWQALVFGILGVRFTEEGPAADAEAASRLPEKWRGAALSLMWRGRRHAVRVERKEGS